MAFTIGSFGLGALSNLAKLMAGFYLTAAIFVVIVLGGVARICGFSIFRFVFYIKEELLLVLGTSSSETALPGIMRKLKRLGCAEGTVGLVIPTGYSFNLDGTNIYLSMAAVFLAQATGTSLSLREQVTLLLVAMLSSKGAAAVTGGGFVTLAATLAAIPSVPIESLALLLGIDRFMSECRALTNLIGNGVATVAISRWEHEVTAAHVRERLPRQKVKPYYLRQRRMLPNHEKSPSLRRGNLHLTGVRSPTTPARSTGGARGIQTCSPREAGPTRSSWLKLGRYSAARHREMR
jgi:aerobic C4-dicarboxylate transport protein